LWFQTRGTQFPASREKYSISYKNTRFRTPKNTIPRQQGKKKNDGDCFRQVTDKLAEKDYTFTTVSGKILIKGIAMTKPDKPNFVFLNNDTNSIRFKNFNPVLILIFS
jgi:hypothetical protein